MRRTLLAILLLAVPAAARGDVWDVSTTDDDDAANTDNELVHGSRQVHDLAAVAGVPDQDWYRVVNFGGSSHEVIVEGATGDIGPGYRLDRVTAGGAVLQTGIPLAGGSGDSRSLRWFDMSGVTSTEYVRVARADCAGSCRPTDQYTVRYYETTGSVVRFNNTGTQLTVLLLDNPTTYTITGRVFFWDSSGTLLTIFPVVPPVFTIAPRSQLILNTATVPALSGVNGHLTVQHDARYGELNSVAIAIEPATGFSLLYPMVPRID